MVIMPIIVASAALITEQEKQIAALVKIRDEVKATEDSRAGEGNRAKHVDEYEKLWSEIGG